MDTQLLTEGERLIERDCFLMFICVWVHMYTACRSQKSSSGMIPKVLSTLGFLDRGMGSLTGVELTKQTRLAVHHTSEVHLFLYPWFWVPAFLT